MAESSFPTPSARQQGLDEGWDFTMYIIRSLVVASPVRQVGTITHTIILLLVRVPLVYSITNLYSPFHNGFHSPIVEYV